MKDRELTKQKIVCAVGEIFRTEGEKGLKIKRIADRAGVDRALIYRYFGKDVKKLIEEYIVQKDHWFQFFEKINAEVGKNSHETSKDLIIDILQNHWRYFSEAREMQQLILWELSGGGDIMRSIHNTRELMAEPILELLDKNFEGSAIKFRPIVVLLLGGIYYANVHAIHNGNIICGMNVKSKEGQDDLVHAIRQIIEWAYENADQVK